MYCVNFSAVKRFETSALWKSRNVNKCQMFHCKIDSVKPIQFGRRKKKRCECPLYPLKTIQLSFCFIYKFSTRTFLLHIFIFVTMKWLTLLLLCACHWNIFENDFKNFLDMVTFKQNMLFSSFNVALLNTVESLFSLQSKWNVS